MDAYDGMYLMEPILWNIYYGTHVGYVCQGAVGAENVVIRWRSREFETTADLQKI
jgi:hypothetical protein